MAKTLSAKGEYWVTSQFVWRYATAAPFKYQNTFSTQIAPGTPGSWITKGIDNAVPTAFSTAGSGGAGDYFAGYYDVGIWRTQDYGGSWVRKNPVFSPWNGYGGSVTGIVTAEYPITLATIASSSKTEADSGNAYLYSLWRSTDFGNTWSVCRDGLPPTGFLYGLSRDPGTGRLWLTRDGYVYTSANAGVSWSAISSSDLPSTGGLYVTAAKNGVVLVGGTHGLYRAASGPYTTWSEIGSGGFDFRDDDMGEVADPDIPSNPLSALHKMRWHGIQQILFDPMVANRVWVVSYYKHSGTPTAGNRVGIWSSDDNGLTFTEVSNARLRRGVAVDSLGKRLHVTSGAALTAGSNTSSELNAAEGKETWRDDGSGTFPIRSTDTGHADYRYPFGATVYVPQDGMIFVGVPGYGFMRQTMLPGSGGGGCGPDPPCETERPGLGGGLAVKLTAEEAKEGEAKGLKLYDLAGRRVNADRPGIYFDGVTRRRIVIVRSRGE